MLDLTNRPDRTMRQYTLWVLIAVELLMSFSFFGYFHVEPISVTTAYIPVLLAGALTGPLEAAAVGTVFGLASMWKASASYVMATDQLFSPLFSGNPIGSLILSVGSRMLFGLAIGLLYALARQLRHPGIWIGVVSYLGRNIHSLLVYCAMGLFFPEAGYGPAETLKGFLHPMDIVANLMTAGVVLVFWRITRSKMWLQFQQRMKISRTLQVWERYNWLSLAVVIVVTLVSSVAVTFYFVHRIDYVLEQNGIDLTALDYADVLHLQIQFLFGIISMMVLVILFLILNRRYTTYMAYEGRLDSLTGVMTRKMFFSSCSQALQAMERREQALGYFIMVDLDYFKEINDTYGHPEGDRALKEVSRSLREIFSRDSLVGRMGGDEFAVLVYWDITAAELEVLLRHFLDRVRRVTWKGRHLTCSIGALPVEVARRPEELYLDADRLLYIAKAQGRNQYVIGSEKLAAAAPQEE